jgi:DNA-binding CsgD family transcriptional regulator/PAS domain-containing protein
MFVRVGREVFDQLVLLAYDAPLHPEGWMPFLRALRAETGSRAACLRWLSLETGRSKLVSAGLEAEALRDYADHFDALDPWTKVAVAPGDDVFGDEMLARATLEASEFYSGFCCPHAIKDIHKAVLARSADNVQVSLGLLKPERTPEHADEQRLTRRLAPLLQRSLALVAWAGDLENQRGALAEALDTASSAVFFLDRKGHVRFCNGAAERIARARDGLSVVKRELRAAQPADERALHAHIADATPHGEGTSGPVLVTRSFGRAPYRVLALPLPERHEDVTSLGITKLVFVVDLESRAVPGADGEVILQRTYGLTPAEARVALRIARGQSPREVAEALATSWYTVRAHLRAVFAKTGTRRQAALVGLVARLDR